MPQVPGPYRVAPQDDAATSPRQPPPHSSPPRRRPPTRRRDVTAAHRQQRRLRTDAYRCDRARHRRSGPRSAPLRPCGRGYPRRAATGGAEEPHNKPDRRHDSPTARRLHAQASRLEPAPCRLPRRTRDRPRGGRGGPMTHPPDWMIEEPCPTCGSLDILECEVRISAEQIRMGWECRDCGHSATWSTSPDAHASHEVERRIVAVMPLHAITAMYGE